MGRRIYTCAMFMTDLYKSGLSKFIKAYGNYRSDYKTLKKLKGNNDDFALSNKRPQLMDRYQSAGSLKGGYFHQDLLIARRIFENKPLKHIDVGSLICGFVAHVASFREITVIDIRPPENDVKNISFIQQDFMAELPEKLLECCDSLSSLHALEHFGLGRYGDPVNYYGHLVGLENLYKMLQKGGTLYLSVPMGIPQRIEFNSHRIFSLKYLLKQIEGKFNLIRFSYVNDKGDLCENVDLTEENINSNFGVKGNGWEALAIFELEKSRF